MAEELNPTEGAAPAEVPPEPRWLFYGISFMVPVAGIVLGALYLSKEDAANKEFGKYCLTAALVNFAIGFSMVCCVVAFYISFFIGYIVFILGLLGVAAGGGLASVSLQPPVPF
ncbi:MAG TPA: hypothetical protein VMW93_01005 [bacterium]|nr:hypothetical protein [bacterium]